MNPSFITQERQDHPLVSWLLALTTQVFFLNWLVVTSLMMFGKPLSKIVPPNQELR